VHPSCFPHGGQRVPAFDPALNHPGSYCVRAAPTRRTRVEFFFDVVSPFSWLGFEFICRHRHLWNLDLQLKPFFLGGVMQHSGNQPPATLPAKAAYMPHDVERLGKLFNVPTKQPSDFASVMSGTLAAQRLLTAVSIGNRDQLEGVARAFWLRVWSRDEDITKPESQRAASIEGGVKEVAVDRLMAAAKEQRIKDELKKNTERACSKGAFGAPWFIVHLPHGEETFFGSDRFETVAMLLGVPYRGTDPDQVGVYPAHKPVRGGTATRSRL